MADKRVCSQCAVPLVRHDFEEGGVWVERWLCPVYIGHQWIDVDAFQLARAQSDAAAKLLREVEAMPPREPWQGA